jgi:hypothetical protein
MIEALNLRTDITARRKKSTTPQPTTETFQFLLFVFDMLELRKLTVDSSFYCATLILAAQHGGLHKRIAYYMSEERRRHKELAISNAQTNADTEADMKWEELLLNYSTYKEETGSDIKLPFVRVSTNDFGRVLAAEQAVQYQPSSLKR